ncbi:MAG TPA: FAD:protein FMN transferase [Streptosporangiaceae bacterium]|nr:FAD:protein FMN transferase [Streptosporangiaceae bacterium]
MMPAATLPGTPSRTPAAADWRAIGTSVRLLVTDPSRLAAGRRLLADDLAALDRACSRFRPDSELAMAERAAGTPVRVSPVLADAVAVALHAAETTDGDLDPTVATAMAALGYDRDFELVTRDGPPLRLTVRSRPSWRQIRLDHEARLLTVPAGVRLDLGATAKARAADLAAAGLAARLGCGVLVSLGGDIAVAGEPPQGGWWIRVQDVTGHPDDPPPGPSAMIAVTAGGLATSGTAARRWRRGRVTLHHILDPRSGLPAAPVWRTVSVAAGTSLAANIASTAAIIRGDAAPGWLAGLGLPARLVAADGTVRTVAGWPAEAAA